MNRINNIPIVDENTRKSLLESQASIIKKYNTDNGSSTLEKQGVLYRYYREPTYFFVNFLLRNGRMPYKEETNNREWIQEYDVINTIKELDNIFKKIKPIPAPIVVYRGIGLNNISGYSNSYQFQSTSFNPDHAYRSLHARGCCLFKITIPAGSKVIFTGNTLDEVILNRNTSIKIIGQSFSNLNGVPMYDTVATTDKLLTMEQFAYLQRQKNNENRQVIKRRQKEIEESKTEVDLILESLALDIQLESIDPNDYMDKLKLSRSDFTKLIEIPEEDDEDNTVKSLKVNYNLIKGQ